MFLLEMNDFWKKKFNLSETARLLRFVAQKANKNASPLPEVYS